MRISVSVLATIAALAASTGAAQAHLGHLGEVAGHSHWIALGAAATAAAITAWIGKRKLDAEKADDELPDQAPEAEGEATEA